MKDIVIENANISIKIIPQLGGKIASIYRKDKAFELLFQGKKEPVKKAGKTPERKKLP